ncbi:MAG: response regulator [Nitrospina sp.]|jgi:CheY-like chemotaxis protein|nr:response regulator [Nitrospina sp.]MBT3857377.1 response regulator [Nitrospina sp.]MBT4105208.1 response regulator [Nitrospina sp.]MBT4388909.1 response regulator [Nitrospina sp.]MBT4620302.1 response regulator [Nitrospina sp.]
MTDTTQNLAGMKVLLVDDTPANIDVLKKTLESLGLNISMAPTGEVALNIAPRILPDLILLDIMMPGIDGFETCQRLKANEVTKSTPVIFISAQVEMAEIEKVFSSGGVDYLNKPFRQEEVLARVSARLEIVKLRQEKDELTSEIKILEEKS